jgi:hypothetical protein
MHSVDAFVYVVMPPNFWEEPLFIEGFGIDFLKIL